MQSRDRLYLIDMVRAADSVLEFTEGHSRESFAGNDMLRTAVIKKLEIMGEAARALPDELKERHPNVPWRQMIGLRHIGVHQYFSIDWHLIWRTASEHVASNRADIAAILATEFPEESEL